MLDDVRRLLDADGLAGVPVLATSAPGTATGIAELRGEIADRVADKKVDPAAARGRPARGGRARLRGGQRHRASPRRCPTERVAALDDAFADAAGVPDRGRRRRAVDPACAPAGPPAGRSTAWLSRLKPDPLKRLHLDLGAAGKELTGRARDLGARRPTQVQRARVDTEVRALADEVSRRAGPAVGGRRPPRLGLPAARPRATALDAAAGRHRPRRRPDPGLGRAGPGPPVAADPRRARRRAVWLGGARGAGATCSCPSPSTPDVGGFPVPTLLLLGGVALGVLLGLVCRLLVVARPRGRGPARPTGGCARRSREVAEELVVEPVEAELGGLPRRARRACATRARVARPAGRPQAGRVAAASSTARVAGVRRGCRRRRAGSVRRTTDRDEETDR